MALGFEVAAPRDAHRKDPNTHVDAILPKPANDTSGANVIDMVCEKGVGSTRYGGTCSWHARGILHGTLRQTLDRHTTDT